MTETSVLSSLVVNSPIAAAVIFVVILFLRRQSQSEKRLLDLYEKNQAIMNQVLKVMGGVQAVIQKCTGPSSKGENEHA